jgi:asparagine synthase (glutamine-hydrolysing)
MCGVLGYFHKESYLANEEFRKSLKLIEHRGPDDFGIERHSSSYGELILGHNRLAIIDLSQLGHQPMHSYCGNFCIVYNGEIYNFKEIKEELKKLGVKFTSTSDTEVLLAAWIHWKEECLNKFLGMFSFAVFDKVEASIFCAVDQFSIKPFYFLANGSEFIFSSEIAPILELTDSSAELDMQASYEYLAYGSYDIEDRTFIKSIKRIKPGHFMKIKLDDF